MANKRKQKRRLSTVKGGHSLSEAEKQALFKQQGGECAARFCHLKIKDGLKLPLRFFEVDHIIPRHDWRWKVNAAERHSKGNLHFLCSHCNREKGQESMDQLELRLRYIMRMHMILRGLLLKHRDTLKPTNALLPLEDLVNAMPGVEESWIVAKIRKLDLRTKKMPGAQHWVFHKDAPLPKQTKLEKRARKKFRQRKYRQVRHLLGPIASTSRSPAQRSLSL